MRVAAGAIAKKFLKSKLSIEIDGYVSQIGKFKIESFEKDEIKNNPFFCPDMNLIPELEKYIDELRKEGDSIGAKITVSASGMPLGLGEPVFDKLDADIAHALMSIKAVKGVEIGSGFEVINLQGSENRDEMSPDGFKSNNSGGSLGGITSGQDIIIRFAVKPTSSILNPKKTINKKHQNVSIITKGRHDPCVGIRAVPIGEAMIAIVLADCFLINKTRKN